MSEATEQIAVRKSPLDDAHASLGASMKELNGWSVPASYGDVMGEYEAVREGGGGVIDLSSRGRIEISGTEAVMFLNGLITNDVKTLGEDAWMHALFPNVQGRLLASARVLHAGDKFLFDTEAATRDAIVKTLARFTLAGDFRLTDVTETTALISLQGAQAHLGLRAVLGEEAERVERGRIVRAEWRNEEVHVIRAPHTAEDGYDLFTSAAHARALWDALREAGARPVGFDALEILRIEAGVPRYGVDMDDSRVVLETGLDDAVSFTKGCYVGQEIIARIHWRGHVAKRLAGLMLDEEGTATVRRDDKIMSAEGKEIGSITSATFSPRMNRSIALGYLKYDYLAPGTKVRISSESLERDASVTELPFVRGSWTRAQAPSGQES